MVKFTSITAAFGLLAFTGQVISAPIAQAIAPPAQAAVRIMPFGASIVGAPGCWRAVLWKKLQDAGIKNTDFVGSRKATDCGAQYKGYDGENEGHAGFQATNIVADNQLPGWLSTSKPDIIMMHLGTNDVIQKKTTQDILNAYTKLVEQMRASKPQMKILVSKLIPIEPGMFGDSDVRIAQLNKAMGSWASEHTTQQSPITIVDNFAGFNPDTDTTDGEHPNDLGNEKLATKFFDPLVSAIRSVN